MKYSEDIRRIVSCKAFRRLAGKTQVFIHPEGDHFRTRLTHTIEVAHLARQLAFNTSVNPFLAEAVALAHDLGHPPFGHSGEDELNQIMTTHGSSFNHNEHTLRIVQKLESYDGVTEGLGLHEDIIWGLIQKRENVTELGHIVNRADTVTYLCHDIDDGIRMGLLKQEEIPGFNTKEYPSKLTFIAAVRETLLTSKAKRVALRQYLEDHLYFPKGVVRESDKHRDVIRNLFNNYTQTQGLSVIVACDYIAGMTDRYAIKYANSLLTNEERKDV